jgi:hypothetical protein
MPLIETGVEITSLNTLTSACCLASNASSADSDEALAAAAKGLDVAESPPVTPPATTYPSPAAVGALARFGLAPKEVRQASCCSLATWQTTSSGDHKPSLRVTNDIC